MPVLTAIVAILLVVKDMACEIIPRQGWLDVLKKRILPEKNI